MSNKKFTRGGIHQYSDFVNLFTHSSNASSRRYVLTTAFVVLLSLTAMLASCKQATGGNENNHINEDSPAPMLITYTVTFDKSADDATGTMASQTFIAGVAQNLAENAFTRTGYVFLGWAKSADGEKKYDNKASITVSTNITLYAKWIASKEITQTDIAELDLSEVAGEYLLKISGAWDNADTANTLHVLGEKIKAAGTSAQITLDMDGLTGIASIGDFSNNSTLYAVILPSGTETITEIAFYGCENLSTITIPNSVKTICSNAFALTAITSLVIPASVEKVNDPADSIIRGCTKLASLTVDEANSYYRSKDNCIYTKDNTTFVCALPALTKLPDFPAETTTIGKASFQNCSLQGEIVLPDSITKMENDSFSDNTEMTSIVLPANLNYLGAYSFASCSKLTKIDFNGNTSGWKCNGEEVTEDLSDAENNATLFAKWSGKYRQESITRE